LGNPALGLRDDSVLRFEGNITTHHARAQKNEIGVQRIEHAVVIDFLELAIEEQRIDLFARGFHFARLAKDLGKEIETARQAAGAVIRQPIKQVDLAVVAIAAVQEIVAGTTTVAESRQLQQRQVKTTAVKRDELGPAT